ncbi:hypothetical protein ACS0TY_003021 [Phlomoides rotata]
MAGAELKILDGAQLREADVSLPPPLPETAITGAEVLELAETRASLSLFGYVLPETLKFSALRRIGVSDATEFRSKKLGYSDASSTLRNYISAIRDELRDNPIVVAICDGKTIHMYLDDEDDFAMLAENLFTDLDLEDRGKISKDEIENALDNMGILSGIPPMSEFPLLSNILNKHGAAGKEELGQAQFAQLLQPVLQEVADSLAKAPIVVDVEHIGVANGSKLRKVVANESVLDEFVQKIMHEKYESNSDASKIRCYLEKHGSDFGLPPSEVDEMVVLFDEIFSEIESRKDGLMVLLKEILEKVAEKLEANPVLYDLPPPQLVVDLPDPSR